MQNRLILLFLLSTMFNAFAQSGNTSGLTPPNLNGKIKSYTEYCYSVDSSSSSLKKGMLTRIWKYNYDTSGMLVLQEKYGSDGVLMDKTIFKYDANRNRTKELILYKDGKVKAKFTFAYNEFNDIITRNFEGSSYLTFTYTYDERGNPKETKTYKDNEFCILMKSGYDENGRLIREELFDKDGNPLPGKGYQYDDIGREIAEIKYREDGSIDEINEFKYDEQNNIVERKDFVGNGNLFRVVEFEFQEFDENRNFLKMIKRENHIPAVILERTYQYY